jgi:methylmalonyl-CoA mutase cobalamin-binding domain/chain
LRATDGTVAYAEQLGRATMSEISQKASQAIDAQCVALAEALVTRQYERQPDIWRPFGDAGRAKSLRDAQYHLSYLSAALNAGDLALFTNYVAWAKALFHGLGFPEQVLGVTLESARYALQRLLPSEMASIAGEFIQAGLDRMDTAPNVPPSFIDDNAPLAELAGEYLHALLKGERYVASHLVLEAVQQGTSVKDIYLHVFQPAQHELGRLWQTGQISVAQEHYCTAATQLVMSQLYPTIFAGDKIGRRLVATCVGGELHEIGMRMVADFFEMEGWDTYYIGANAPTESILRTLQERQVDVLGVSVTMTFHVSAVEKLIARVRASGAGRLKIIVGGYPFNIAPELWRQTGADGWAHDAQQAIAIAGRLVTNGVCG